LSETTRRKELAALTAIAAQVNCTQDLAEILQAALETTLDVIGEQSGEIFLLDEEAGELVLHTHQGVSQAFVHEESHIGSQECLCGQAVQTRQMLVTSDLAGHSLRTRTACVREGFRSCVRLPLLARGQVLGLLNIQSPDQRDFERDDLELLTAIGNQIGIAIANAQLIEDAERRRATLDSVMNSLVDGLILLNHHRLISYVNPCAETILDLPAGDLVGQTLAAMGHAIAGRVDEPEAMLRALEAAASNVEDTPTVEFSLNKPETRTLQVRMFPIHRPEDGWQGMALLLHDITRERELDQMKSQLLSTISHELRTPLASIKGFATTLLREDVDWDETSRREFLSIIDEESDRLSELIGNLLDMSRIEAGELPVEPEPIDLVPIIQETLAEFQMMTRDHHFRLHLPATIPLVMADPRRTRQVLRNLVENAVKYSPGGGPISIAARPSEGTIVVSVADRGIGIDPQQLARVFDRFYQVDSASTRQVGGSGLGLSISKAIVEAQEGSIWAESEAGVGSTFYFSLPLVQSLPGSRQATTPD
jgi:signal transduction histidine kinase